MAETHRFKQEQRGVALAMAGALAVTILAGMIALGVDPGTRPMPFATRLQATLRADLFVVGWLAAAIANVARLRFFSAADIAGSAGSGTDEVRRAGAVLQNTFEQVGLAVLAHLVLAATLEHPGPLIATLVGFFCVGRLCFWTGYKRGPTGRAFGFALTFYPSVGALILAGAALSLGRAA